MTASRIVTTTSAAISVTDEELQVLRETLNPDLSPAELRLFALVAKRSGLDPFARQIYAIKRRGRLTVQTSIDGLRSIAARTGEYDGQDEPEYGPPIEKPWLHPQWATVRVFRKGMSRGVAATVRWDEYVPADGQDMMWRKLPYAMLGKVAEAAALRKAFPYVTADVYTNDEMDQADAPPAPVALTARERLAARRAELHSVEPAAPDTTVATEGARPDATDDMPPARELTREAFLELATASGIDRGAIAKAAAEAFPGVLSRHYTPAQWDALAERLGLLRDQP